MKILRKQGKVDILVEIFPNVGDKLTVKKVLDATGIINYNSLKAFCSYIRRAGHIPEENRINLRLKDDICTREEM